MTKNCVLFLAILIEMGVLGLVPRGTFYWVIWIAELNLELMCLHQDVFQIWWRKGPSFYFITGGLRGVAGAITPPGAPEFKKKKLSKTC